MAMACRAVASLLVLLALPASAAAAAAGEVALARGPNPIRKVVTFLQNMEKKVKEEGEKEKALYEKFMCHCKSNLGELKKSIAAAEARSPTLKADLKAAEEQKVQLEAEVKQAKADRVAAEKAITEATALREKDAAAFVKDLAEQEKTYATVDKAVKVLAKGTATSFLQSGEAQALRQLALDMDGLEDADRQGLVAFLESGADSDYAPQSGEIVGILKAMGDQMQADIAKTKKTEEAALAAFKSLVAAKQREVKALTEAVEAKSQRVGELGVSIVQMKHELGDGARELEEDKQFLADLEKGCSTKTAEWEARQKTRGEELVALADTIKLLNDDEALDLFKKTLDKKKPASFLQMEAGSGTLRARALAQLRGVRARHGDQAQLDLIALALNGRKIGFEKVLKMVDEMVETLKAEGAADEKKKDYCKAQLAAAADKSKDLNRTIGDKETAIASAQEGLKVVLEEIKAVEASIKLLDKSVAEATEQRKAENKEFTELVSSNNAAKDLLGMAKQRLNKFYNPSLAKQEAPAPALVQVQQHVQLEEAEADLAGGLAEEEEQEELELAQAQAPTAEPAKKVRAGREKAPETFSGPYAKKGEESNGVLGMLDTLVGDLEKENVQAETQEKEAQKSYEKMMKDSGDKRALATKSLADKAGVKADKEAKIQELTGAKTATAKELMANEKLTQSLHLECDWLLQYFDTRKEARSSEIESLGRAKATLSGAKYSMLQTASRGFLARQGA